ncbi:THAP domain-containing protein 2-like [Scylla paramamosain]|uniref:THAP domain-containing protein 2-like n=1 Tax=Scylla paramamosain TaxID=85552 RepID=UPI0030838DDF
MPNRCIAFGCTEKKNKRSDSSITFHKLPKDPCRRQKWVLAMLRDEHTPGKKARLCSRHFGPEDFDRARLLDDAVPSVFNVFPVHLQKKRNKSEREEREQVCSGY